jgi:hypothetical protein
MWRIAAIYDDEVEQFENAFEIFGMVEDISKTEHHGLASIVRIIVCSCKHRLNDSRVNFTGNGGNLRRCFSTTFHADYLCRGSSDERDLAAKPWLGSIYKTKTNTPNRLGMNYIHRAILLTSTTCAKVTHLATLVAGEPVVRAIPLLF